MKIDLVFRNALVASLTTVLTAALLAAVGWWLLEFDRALFPYAMALIASLGLTVYRFTIWTHRPPTNILFVRAFSMLRHPRNAFALAKHLTVRVLSYFVLNLFVWRRGQPSRGKATSPTQAVRGSLTRWGAHWPIMIGCLMAMAVVVPLIFGWVWFESPTDDFLAYHVIAFGIPVRTIPVNGIEAFIAFHGLVWAAFFVVAGTTVGLWRRMRDRGDKAVQTFGNDVAPLFVLWAIAVTGLLMTISYSFLNGVAHAPIAKIHMAIVVGALLWLPFSKLFHIPQRSLKLAQMIYEHESTIHGPANCARCGDAFAAQQHVDDLIAIQAQLGYRYEIQSPPGDQPIANHYQMICPRCRRASLVMTQSQRWNKSPMLTTSSSLKASSNERFRRGV